MTNGTWYVLLQSGNVFELGGITNVFVSKQKIIQTIASFWCENMLGYLSTGIICSEKQTVFWEHSLRKTVSFEKQIMSKDKHLGIFSPQMEVIVFIILQVLFTTFDVFRFLLLVHVVEDPDPNHFHPTFLSHWIL